MRPTHDRKLRLHTETLRNLQPDELQRAAGGRGVGDTTAPQYPTQSEVAGGCTVTSPVSNFCSIACTWFC